MENTQNLNTSEYLDRNIFPLPNEECNITILTNEGEFTGKWKPKDPKDRRLSEGYLGTVRVNLDNGAKIGFHAWQQNDSEFQYYKIVE